MNRAVVLIVCLLGAAGITAYSYGQRDMGGDPQGDVYVVPQRNPLPPPTPPAEAVVAKPVETPAERIALVRSLQFELKRVGCYSGEVNGVWTTSSRMAMKSFTERVNASLPIDNPDPVLLSLVKGHQDQACPGGTTRAAKTEVKSEDGDGKTGALVAGGAAAAGAAAAMAVSRPDAKADDRPRRVSAPPDGGAAGPGKGPQQDAVGGAKASGPVPPEGVKDKAKSKQAKKPNSQQPKFVRDFLKALGIKQ